MSVRIIPAEFDKPEFAALIDTHSQLMLANSPPGSCHFLPLESLRQPNVTVWEMRDGDTLVGCGGLKHLTADHGEVKSMHTLSEHRGSGLGREMLDHVIAEARNRGYTKLSLETGSMDAFIPSRQLYQSRGFKVCPPFGDYVEDPYSVFMTLDL